VRKSTVWIRAEETATNQIAGLIGPLTQGVVITVHGYNVDSKLEAGMGAADGTLRTYYPGFQSLLYDASLADVPAYNPETKAGFLVLHVAWLGNWDTNRLAPTAGFFNWDNALAFDAGNRVAWQVIKEIDDARRAQGIPRTQFPISVCAESLGNRVAASLINGLKGQFSLDPNAPEPQAVFPQVRYAMLHPALRHVDIGNANQLNELALSQLPHSPLQSEIAGLTTNEQRAFLIYSPFDKPGLVFNSVQNADGPLFQPPGSEDAWQSGTKR